MATDSVAIRRSRILDRIKRLLALRQQECDHELRRLVADVDDVVLMAGEIEERVTGFVLYAGFAVGAVE